MVEENSEVTFTTHNSYGKSRLLVPLYIYPVVLCFPFLYLFTRPFDSETTPEGRKITKLDQILLNGNNITMLVPGGEYPVINLMRLDIRSPEELL